MVNSGRLQIPVLEVLEELLLLILVSDFDFVCRVVVLVSIPRLISSSVVVA